MKKLIIAIDLGSTKVVCAVGEKTASGVKIIAVEQAPSKGIARGAVVNIQQAMDIVSPIISKVENNIQENIKEIFVGVSGQHIRCTSNSEKIIRSNPDDLITITEIENISNNMYNISHQIDERVIHVIPQSFNIDDFMGITTPIGMMGKEVNANFKLVIGKGTSIDYTNNVIKRGGYKVRGQIFNHLAFSKAVVHEEECEIGVAIVDIGGGTTDLIIIQDNIVRHVAVIPFGGNSITEDIRMGCGVSLKQAEQLKIDHGSCFSEYAPEGRSIVIPSVTGNENKELSYKLLAEIIEARTAEILEAVDYEINLSGYKESLRAGLVITGGTAELSNIGKLASLITGLQTRGAVPISDIEVDDDLMNIRKPHLSNAIGLVLKGYEILEKEGGIYGTTTPMINSLFGEINNGEEKKETKKEGEEEGGEEPKKKEKMGYFARIKKSLSSDNIFNDNNA